MNVPNLKRMTAEEYALWAERQETGRFELVDGMVVQMNAETADHALTKLNVAIALKRALQAAGLVGQVFGDGMALRIADNTAHEPDALLRIGPKLPGRTVLVTDAVVVVEVLSRSTGPVDTGRKLTISRSRVCSITSSSIRRSLSCCTMFAAPTVNRR